MRFGSDNQTGCAQQVLDAIVAANGGHTHGYGNDAWTSGAIDALREVFETDLDAFFVATDTAANCLALSNLVQPWQVILTHVQSHVAIDESTAPEFFTGGARVQGPGFGAGKLTTPMLQDRLARMGSDFPHNAQAGAISITQATECGLVYSAAEVAQLAECAHAHSMHVHMDGARISNALAAQACSPADLTWRAGVDMLTLGASKNGCLAAEAILVFRKELVPGIEQRRKRSGHLLSKGRFFGAQILAWLDNGLWLDLARHANQQATELARRLATVPTVSLAWPVQANEVFVVMPTAGYAHLQQQDAECYKWYPDALPGGWTLKPGESFVRLVCSFATTQNHLDQLMSHIRHPSALR
jgi:threonine aldolase